MTRVYITQFKSKEYSCHSTLIAQIMRQSLERPRTGTECTIVHEVHEYRKAQA